MISFPVPQVRVLKSPLGISICAHLIILALLALIVVKPDRAPSWHDFEWLSELLDDPPVYNQALAAEDAASAESASAEASTTDQSSPAVPNAPSPAPNAVQPKRQVIDAPGELADPSLSSSPKVVTNLGSRGTVNRSGLIQGSGTGGFSSKLEGKGIRSKKEVLPSLKVSDYGEVKLSFRVSGSGLVLPNSIRVEKSATSAQNQSAIEALKQWEFIVAPGNSADQSYSILFIYNPGK